MVRSLNIYKIIKFIFIFLFLARSPSKWIQPIESAALYDFQARNPAELSISAGQRIIIAPKEIQNTLALLNTGWAMASTDGQNAGIIPINYVKSPQQMRQEQITKPQLDVQPTHHIPHVATPMENFGAPRPELMNLSANAFPSPPTIQQDTAFIDDFEIAPQPIGPPQTVDVALQNGF